MSASTVVGTLLLLASAAGTFLLLWAVVLVGRTREPDDVNDDQRPVTLLKPLHGAEPRLAANLASFCDQDRSAPVQMLCGVRLPDDGAVAAVQDVIAQGGSADVSLVVNQRSHGSNAKVSTLVNLMHHARHDIVIVSDSDISVDRRYLRRIVAALGRPGVGAVSCLYRGRADAGLWSRFCAMGIDLHFLPSVLIGLGTGLAKPCMGSTIALRRDTLERIGGFAAFASTLADDHAIGAAVAALGLTVAVPAMPVTHACDDRTLPDLLRHELRWQATIAGIDPAGHAGSAVLHPVILALIAALMIRPMPPLAVAAAALAARLAFAWRLGRVHGGTTRSLVLLPLRELLSFGVFVASFFVRTVDWRGKRLTVHAGLIAPAMEIIP